MNFNRSIDGSSWTRDKKTLVDLNFFDKTLESGGQIRTSISNCRFSYRIYKIKLLAFVDAKLSLTGRVRLC